ncbi:(2Fe-2S)-binding protein [Spiribacter halobius]|uniref:Bacterioferritin-associated ferredoxin n=1 Tax=Sediminicurvatus halobius TaxID=2182432 RepID=A0A2U2MW37_9GAMM|nr:(2Fe-2S)-binding protein [Spiribacter halobius]PWG61032.1 bacterioferritin [Spiribacter halobius]UEX77415.1 (2Fe-2S)-binding protein [Spiribacter halobius]
MYVCVCKAVTDSQIRAALDDGARSVGDLRRELGCCTGCGRCGPFVRAIVAEYKAEERLFPLMPQATPA